mmetsp:Transcript_3768/g.11157  ORF Transcript_3768/g.11157 Transcript_3768/m.11157 type:complete len:86 (+) Transcript_3768:242-499(+)
MLLRSSEQWHRALGFAQRLQRDLKNFRRNNSSFPNRLRAPPSLCFTVDESLAASGGLFLYLADAYEADGSLNPEKGMPAGRRGVA